MVLGVFYGTYRAIFVSKSGMMIEEGFENGVMFAIYLGALGLVIGLIVNLMKRIKVKAGRG